jgi:hypothetical protein
LSSKVGKFLKAKADNQLKQNKIEEIRLKKEAEGEERLLKH